jgi:hypothetical protein
MKYLIRSVLVSIVFLGSSAAWADTYTTYDVNLTFASGNTLTGSFEVDSTSFETVGLEVGYSIDVLSFTSAEPGISTAGGYSSDSVAYLPGALGNSQSVTFYDENFSFDDPGSVATLSLVTEGSIAGTLVPFFEGSNFRAIRSFAYTPEGGVDSVISGTITPASTPEPSTLFLLTTGLGACLAVRKRFWDRHSSHPFLS